MVTKTIDERIKNISGRYDESDDDYYNGHIIGKLKLGKQFL